LFFRGEIVENYLMVSEYLLIKKLLYFENLKILEIKT